MILNKQEDLEENQCFYDLFKKGVTENYKRYCILLKLTYTGNKKYWLENIKEIKFYHQSLIIHSTLGDSILLKYEDIKELQLVLLKPE